MDFIVFSHLRWNFVFQRPQHLMSRFAKSNRVLFWEEPCFDSESPFIEMTTTPQGVQVVVPHLPSGLSEAQNHEIQRRLLDAMATREALTRPVIWYYNPMAVRFCQNLASCVDVYDCMDELSAFRGAPAGLRAAEAELFTKADIVFTGGQSLYQAKKGQHRAVYCFPSSIDKEFFATARTECSQPPDQADIPSPRLGYCGVIDERMDVELLRDAAALRPDWHFIMVGPVVKVSESELPHAPNIHWLGSKPYAELPNYMAGWDVGILPFGRNESTRFISPTKTPEYLAAGLPVVSTSITDVVRPYGRQELAHIADDAETFIRAAERAMAEKNSPARLARADKFLENMSWDFTWKGMDELIEGSIQTRQSKRKLALNLGVLATTPLPPQPSTRAIAE